MKCRKHQQRLWFKEKCNYRSYNIFGSLGLGILLRHVEKYCLIALVIDLFVCTLSCESHSINWSHQKQFMKFLLASESQI